MKSLKLLVIGIIFALGKLHATSVVETFDSANTYYTNANYTKAIATYESIISSGYESAELYYNLGNAYFKSNKMGLAILNYERAKKIDRNNEDINFNLKLANQRIVDKIDVVPELFISKILGDDFNNYKSQQSLSIQSIVGFFLFCAFLVIYFLTGTVVIKRAFFFLSLIAILYTGIVFVLAKKSYNRLTLKNDAIVMAQSITAKGSPSENGTKLFILHEGTRVKVESYNHDWVEIKLTNGNVGWVPSSSIATF